MFKIWFTNFGYFSSNESETLEGAKKICRQASFQSQVIDSKGDTVATYCPISGWQEIRPWKLASGQ